MTKETFDFDLPMPWSWIPPSGKLNFGEIHPDAPTGGGGLGKFKSVLILGLDPNQDKWRAPAARGKVAGVAPEKLTISGVIVAGGTLSNATVVQMNKVAVRTPAQWRRYIAYASLVKVGGSLAWRANNPGNLRDASTKIGSVSGAVGHFAVFESLDAGRQAQKDLYLTKYGAMTVRRAIDKLTPPSENDTARYLSDLQQAGVDLDKDVKSQIDLLMVAIEANEGMISGIEVARLP